MGRLWLIGRQGQVVETLEEEQIIHGGITPPLLEMTTAAFFPPKLYPIKIPAWRKKSISQGIIKAVTPLYNNWGKFGPYGDLIQVTFTNGKKNEMFIIDFMGQLAWPKPSLAADLIPIIRDANRNLFFIGITRKKSPGIGKPALIGGHLDVKGYHLETAAEALIHEARDEVGIKITVMKQFAPDIKKKPFMSQIPVSVKLYGYKKIVHTDMLLVGTFETSKEEKLSNLGQRRIYQTTAYAMIIDIENWVLNPGQAASFFQSGDDAASIYAMQLLPAKTPPFAIKHHQTIFVKTIEKLLRESRIA